MATLRVVVFWAAVACAVVAFAVATSLIGWTNWEAWTSAAIALGLLSRAP
jgi:hypothetical protein